MKLKEIKVLHNPLNYLLYLKFFYLKKKFIILFTTIFIIIGVIYSLSIKPEYKSTTIIVPQSNKQNDIGAINSIASIAGINLNNSYNSVDISPNLYPLLIENLSFLKSIINKDLISIDSNKKISFKNYFSSDINKEKDSNFFKILIENLNNFLFKSNNENESNNEIISNYAISKTDKSLIDIFHSRVSLEVLPLDGYIEISAIMPEPIAASEMANNTRIQLQEEIINFKIKKAESKLNFLLERLKDVKKTYDLNKSALAKFKEENKSINSIFQQNKLDELIAENSLSFNLYSDIKKQIENQRITVKEETPVFTIIKEPIVPLERFKPKRKSIVINFMLFGFLLSIFILLSKSIFEKGISILFK